MCKILSFTNYFNLINIIKYISHQRSPLHWLLLFLFFCCLPSLVEAQESTLTDSTQAKATDSLEIKNEGIETTIAYTAEDSIVSNLINNTVYLYGKATVTYGEISLNAEQIEINQNTKVVVARGMADSTGKYRGNPVFTQGSESYEADSMRYNFETKKGVVIGIVTQQGEGYIQSDKAKRLEDGTMFASGNRYTTCNLKHPHWYINTNKIKMIPGKQVVSGPFNLVLSDVPTPLGFAFGIFPFVDKQKSGIIFPTYGESADRGFFLRNGGYYWYINEYVTLDVRGEIYTNGSYGLEVAVPYRKRYRYSGSSSVRYSKRFQGEGDEKADFTDFWIRWSHVPVPRGKSSFSASVNFGTSRFNQRNSFNPQDQLSNNFSSNISYNTSFKVGDTPVTLGLAARQDQNSRTNVMNVTLPSLNLTVNRIYPFKKKGETARNFIQKLNFNYSFTALAKFTNQPLNYNSFPFTLGNRPLGSNGEPIPSDSLQLDFNFANLSEIAKNARIGGIHTIPISTSIKFLKAFSFNPSFTYTEAWYPKQLDYTYNPADTTVRVDTLAGFRRVYSYSTGASLTTRIYGIFNLNVNKKDRYFQSIRHTIVPTIGFSYQPELAGEAQGVYETVQVDGEGNTALLSRYAGFEPGAPANVGASGVLTFNVQNIFEAKVRPRKDTVDEKKITLLDNLSFGGSYNLVRDSLKLSNISIAARTKLLNLIDFNFTGSLDPYVYRILEADEDGNITRQARVNKYTWQEGRGIGQLSNFNVSMGFSLTPQTFKNGVEKKAQATKDDSQKTIGRNITEGESMELQRIANNPDEYIDFDIPWSLNINYNLSYNKTGFLESRVSQKLNLRGDVSLSETWKIGFQTGYDFDLKQVSFTNIDISKDLHCWDMRINWNPFGQFKSYSFDLRVKSSILQDLKISRRRSFYDRNF